MEVLVQTRVPMPWTRQPRGDGQIAGRGRSVPVPPFATIRGGDPRRRLHPRH